MPNRRRNKGAQVHDARRIDIFRVFSGDCAVRMISRENVASVRRALFGTGIDRI
jgi:hypothetical protein